MAIAIRVADINRVDHDIFIYDELKDIKFSRDNDGRYSLTVEDIIDDIITNDMVGEYISNHNLDPDDVGFDEEEITERYLETIDGSELYRYIKDNQEGLEELLTLIPKEMLMKEVERRGEKDR